MTDAHPFAKMVPGFDFLQGLMKNASAAIPPVGQWVAPTLNPEELDKRIQELRTVQFWLEQNAKLLGATIQALEVQRMTLSTLKSMNVSMGDLREAMTLKMPAAPVAAASPFSPPAPAPAPTPAPAAAAPAQPADAPPPAAGVIDPMQWWGALTKQFGEIAASALPDMAAAASAAASRAPATAKPAAKAAAKKAPAKAKPAARKTATSRGGAGSSLKKGPRTPGI